MKPFYEARKESFFIGGMTKYPFPIHVHEVVEAGVLLHGEAEMELDGKRYTLQRGDAFVAFPLVPHGYEKLSEDSRGLAAFFLPALLSDLTPVFNTMRPECPVIRSSRLNRDVLLSVVKLDGLPENSPSRIPYLHLLLANLLSVMDLKPAGSAWERDLGSRIIRYVYDHAFEHISLEDVSKALGISVSHLSHLFAGQFHVNFRQFINAIRIDKAISMIHESDMTLTEVCFATGFENQRTFRRAFQHETGRLPAEYIRDARSKK